MIQFDHIRTSHNSYVENNLTNIAFFRNIDIDFYTNINIKGKKIFEIKIYIIIVYNNYKKKCNIMIKRIV